MVSKIVFAKRRSMPLQNSTAASIHTLVHSASHCTGWVISVSTRPYESTFVSPFIVAGFLAEAAAGPNQQ